MEQAESFWHDNPERYDNTIGIGLICTISIALFWGVYRLFAGAVPVVSTITLTSTWTETLPFAVSRFWDVTFGFWFVLFFRVIFCSDYGITATEDDEAAPGLCVSVIACPIASLCFIFGMSTLWSALAGCIPAVCAALFLACTFPDRDEFDGYLYTPGRVIDLSTYVAPGIAFLGVFLLTACFRGIVLGFAVAVASSLGVTIATFMGLTVGFLARWFWRRIAGILPTRSIAP